MLPASEQLGQFCTVKELVNKMGNLIIPPLILQTLQCKSLPESMKPLSNYFFMGLIALDLKM
jgi:hypothetical protein